MTKRCSLFGGMLIAAARCRRAAGGAPRRRQRWAGISRINRVDHDTGADARPDRMELRRTMAMRRTARALMTGLGFARHFRVCTFGSPGPCPDCPICPGSVARARSLEGDSPAQWQGSNHHRATDCCSSSDCSLAPPGCSFPATGLTWSGNGTLTPARSLPQTALPRQRRWKSKANAPIGSGCSASSWHSLRAWNTVQFRPPRRPDCGGSRRVIAAPTAP